MRTTMKAACSMLTLAFVLSSMIAFGQATKTAPSSPVAIRVAYPLSVQCDHNFDFGWRVKGEMHCIPATELPNPAKETHVMVFSVHGEAGFHITVQFPLTATVYRLGNPSLDQIAFTRKTVITNSMNSQGGATLFLTEGTPSGTTTLPGTLGQTDQPMTRWFFIGGCVTIPAGVPSSTNYSGPYTVTVTNYSV